MIAEIYSTQPGRAEKLKSVVLECGERRRAAQIEHVWRHDGRPIVKIAGIDSIGEAEQWAGADLLVRVEDRAAPGEGEYSHQDLIGCRIIAESEIGTVVRVEDYGGTPLLTVETPAGEVLIPFARSICREIDVSAKRIRVELPEGLLEL